jgi:hypothetical protein
MSKSCVAGIEAGEVVVKARSKGMAQIARGLNLDRASLYKSITCGKFIFLYGGESSCSFRLRVDQKMSA